MRKNTVSFYRKHAPMTDDAIRNLAPSVFATQAAPGLTEKYAFIPTTRVLEVLRDHGWSVVFAAQSRAKTPDGREFMRHMLRFQEFSKDALAVGDCKGELVVTNSHNGTSAYRLSGGLYRAICANGLMIADATIESARIRHVGFKEQMVIEAATRIAEQLPLVGPTIKTMQGRKLSEPERLEFAEAARQLRWDGRAAPVEATRLLAPRRPADNGHDAWTVFNVVQENLVLGGVAGHTNGKRPRAMVTREIASVNGNLRLNRGLWELAERTLLPAA